MALNFPSSPTDGQIETLGGRDWQFTTGKGWLPLDNNAIPYGVATTSNPASLEFAEDVDNGTNKVTVKAPAALSADATVNLPSATGDVLSTGESKTLTKGFAVTPYSVGSVVSGTITPDPANGNYQYLTNDGAFTLAAPAVDCAIDLLVVNGGSAGNITFSGFKTPGAVAAGVPYVTTGSTWWWISLRRVNGVATYAVNGPWT